MNKKSHIVQYFEGLSQQDTTAATCICNVTLGSECPINDVLGAREATGLGLS